MLRSGVLVPLFLLASCAVSRVPEPVPSPPEPLGEPFRLLLLGDSISIGYTPFVRKLLDERAFVMRARKADGRSIENCAGTNYVTHPLGHPERLERWLAQDDGRWDVIHFNFGLHDLKRVDPETGKNSNDPNDPHQADPARYEAQLREIVLRLQATGARLVFATTTPVPEGPRPYRAPEDAIEYNRIASQVMGEHGVAINDLYAFALPRLSKLQKRKDVHFNEEGSRALAEAVVDSVLRTAGLPQQD